jgi:hypothetical protein
MKRMVHKIGFLSWVGEDALLVPPPFSSSRTNFQNPKPLTLTQGDNLARLTSAFETLDPETSFQSLASLASTILSGKWRERRAIAEIDEVLSGIMRSRGSQVTDDNLNTLHNGFKQEFPGLSERARARMCAHTVFQFHLASQANLYAALSWTLVNLLTQPAALASRVVEEHERLCRDFGPLYAAPPARAARYDAHRALVGGAVENCCSSVHTYGRRYLNDMDALEKSHEWLVQVREQPCSFIIFTPNP